MVTQQVGRWICDHKVAVSTPGCVTILKPIGLSHQKDAVGDGRADFAPGAVTLSTGRNIRVVLIVAHSLHYLIRSSAMAEGPRDVNSCSVSRAMEIRKASNHKSDLQNHRRALVIRYDTVDLRALKS